MTIAENNEKWFEAMRRGKNPRSVILHESEVVATRRELDALRRVAAQARALTEDPNACWEDLLAALDNLGGAS